MLATHVIHIGNAQDAAQLLGGHFHRSWRRRLARLRLRERSRAGGVKRDISLDLLHGLVNMPVENGNRAELLQIRESLRTVFGSPTPFRVDRPQWDVRKDDNRGAGLEMLDVIFKPLELLVSQRAEPAGFQVHDIDQSDEVYPLLLEAIPAALLSPFGETLVILFTVIIQNIVLARDIEDILCRGTLQNLLDGVEFLGLRELADIPCVQQELRRRR